jgi:hypothetical protein
MNDMKSESGQASVGAVMVGALIVIVLGIILGLMFALPAYSRYQARANAKNETITSIKQIQIAKNLAQARYQTSIGLRRSQDEIRKTLSPLYVQFELTQALQAIATSGSNDTVIYLPTDPKNGLPVVPTSNVKPQQP